MKINWKKWNRILHRDLGYIFFGMTIIYALSGIALNHIKDWNPSYDITPKEIQLENVLSRDMIQEENVLNILKKFGEEDNYKKHYFPSLNHLKIFRS